MIKDFRLKVLNILSIIIILLNYMPFKVISETVDIQKEKIKVESFDYKSQDDSGTTLNLSLNIHNESAKTLKKELTINGSPIVSIGEDQDSHSDLTGVTLSSKSQTLPNNDDKSNNFTDDIVSLSEHQIEVKVSPSISKVVSFSIVISKLSDLNQVSAEIEDQKITLSNLPDSSKAMASESSTSSMSTSKNADLSNIEQSSSMSTHLSSETGSSKNEETPPQSSSKDSTTSQEDEADVPTLEKISPKDISDLFENYAPGDTFIQSAQVSPNPITNPDNVGFKVNFSAPSAVSAQMRPGDVYSFPLPESLQFSDANPTIIDLKDDDGNFLGKASVDFSKGTITITLTDKAGNIPEDYDPDNYIPMSKAELSLSTKINKTIITQPGTHQITYPKEYKLPPQTVFIKPHVDTSISKSGSLDKQLNPTKITWTVDVNKTLDTLENPVLDESFPSQVSYQSVTLYPLTLDFSGNVTSVGTTPLVKGVDYDVDNNGNVSFIGKVNEAFRAIYITSINDDAKPTQGGTTSPITNTATWNGSPASATVQGNYGKRLEKINPTYNSNTQTYNWTVRYNYGQKEVNTIDPIIDTYSNNMDLDLSSVHLFYMTINANGSATKGAEVSKEDYSINQKLNSSSGQNQLIVQLKEGIDENQAINLYYNTTVNQIVSIDNPQDVKVSNSVDQDGIPPVSPPGISQPKQQVIIKNTPTLDLNNKIATWTIDVNKNNYELNQASFIDKIDYSELGYVSIPGYAESGEFKKPIPLIQDLTTTKTLNGALRINGAITNFPGTETDLSKADYVVDITTVPNPSGPQIAYQNMKITLLNNYLKTDHRFRISYSVQYNKYSDGAIVPSSLTYGNKMDVNWVDRDGGKRTSTSNHGFTTTTSEANQGLKTGDYNAVTKEITWTIIANYNDEGSQYFNVKDPILSNNDKEDVENSQTYVSGSLSILRGRVDKSGKFVPASDPSYSGEQKNKDYINFNEPEKSNNLLNINLGNRKTVIPGWDSEAPMVYQIQFKTSLKGKEVNRATFSNVATTDVLGIKNTLSAKVSVKYGGQPLAKIGTYANNKVNWALTINQAQSKLTNPVVSDTPSNNQVILPDSIALYPTMVDKYGTITKDSSHPLILNQDYNIQLSTEPTTGQQSLVVSFDKSYKEAGQSDFQTIERPYILEYQSKPNLSSNSETVTNNASLKADGTEIINPDVTTSTVVKIPSGSGFAYGKKGKVSVKKINEEGSPLAGAQLELVRVYKNSSIAPEVMYDVTTPQNGEVTFGNLVYTDSSPNGFKYLLKELKAPSGYTVSPELKDGKELIVNDQSSQTNSVPITIQNDSVSLTFNKKSESGQNISGGTFVLEKLDDKGGLIRVEKTFSASVSGVVLNHLEIGSYQIRETAVPTDEKGALYLTNPKVMKFLVKDIGAGVIKIFSVDQPNQAINSLQMVNYQGRAQLIKENQYGGPIENAEFKVRWAPFNSETYTEVTPPQGQVFKTDTKGLLNLTQLRPGKYEVQESRAPEGYYINPKTYSFNIDGQASEVPQTIQINSSAPLIDYKGSAQFTKTAEDGKSPLSGAEFILLDASGHYLNGKGEVVSEMGLAQRVKSDFMGHFEVTGLSPATSYQLVEVMAPIGYVINDSPLTFTMPASDLGQSTGVINDAAHQIVYQADSPYLNYNWKIYWDKVGQNKLSDEDKQPLGGAYYKLYQKNAAGEFKDITESEGDFGQVEKSIKGQLEKVFESNPITGRVSAVNLPGGDYFYQEVKAPEGYILDDTKYSFTLPMDFEPENGDMINVSPTEIGTVSGDNLSISIHYDKKGLVQSSLINYKGAVEMKKVDDEGKPLSGAKFKVYNTENQEVEEEGEPLIVTSQEDGTVYAEGLSPGAYYFQEVATPENQYLINSTKVPFTIDTHASGKPAVKVIMDGSKEYQLPNYKGSAQLTKIDAKTKMGLAGAQFEVYNASNEKVSSDQPIVSDNKGKVSIDHLSPGSYYFKEVKAPEGYLINSTLVHFNIDTRSNGAPDRVITQPDGKPLELEDYKGESELRKISEDGTKLAGAVFELVDKDGNKLPGYEHLVSDPEGKVTASDLAPGTYQFVEIEAPVGYILDTKSLPQFTIPNQAEGEPEVVNLDENGEKLVATNYKGSARLQKIGNEHGKEVGLAGAYFKVIDSKTGKGIKGFEKLRSNAQGMVVAKGLAPGDYKFQEIQAAPDYILNPSPSKTFSISESSSGEPDMVDVGKFINFKGTITLRKVDNHDHPLAGAIFEIWNLSGKKAKLVSGYGDVVSSANGVVAVTGLAPGKYQLREVKAPQDFIINTSPINFKIVSKSIHQPTIKLGNFINTKGSVTMKKVSENGKPLSGAEFQLRREPKRGNMVVKDYEKVISLKNGKISASNLPPGDYAWIEIKAPKGYQLNKDPIYFTIPKATKNYQSLKIKDFVNKKIATPNKILPRTGEGKSANILKISGGLIITFLIVIIFRKYKKA
jgi:Predicted outer membrane protein